MKILEMRLSNFQGITEFSLKPDGKNVSVYGDNGTGKTTLDNAFCWLWYGKPSTDEKGYTPKTTDSHKLNHIVELVVEHNGGTISIKKDYHEIYKSKRNSVEKEFSGHTSTFYIDDMEVPAKDFQKKLDEICPPETAKKLTRFNYFLEDFPVKDRRTELMDMCGGVSDDDVIAGEQKLSSLPGILQGKDIASYEKLANTKIKALKKESDQIPARIDEIKKGLPELPENKEFYEKQLQELKEKKARLEEKKADGQDGTAAEIRKQIAELEAKKARAETEHQNSVLQSINLSNCEIIKFQAEKVSYESEISKLQGEKRDLLSEIHYMETERERLIKEWQEVNGRVFESEDTCPYCGQEIPEEKIEESKKAFNVKKSNDLEKISEAGKAVSKEKIAEMQSKIPEIDSKTAEFEKKMAEIDLKIKETRESNSLIPKFADTEQCKEYDSKIAGLKESLKKANEKSMENSVDIFREINAVEDEITAVMENLAEYKRLEKDTVRIQELQTKYDEIVSESEDYEYGLHLCKIFNRKKAELMDEKINSKFKTLKFRLFKELVNGDFEDDCEALIPCESGLIPFKSANNAARINAGLEMIEALSGYYGVEMPVFIDNAESCSRILDTKGQQIRLYVSEKDKELRCEYMG